MNKYAFSVIIPSENDWIEVESCVDATVFHTRLWSSFLSSLKKRPIVIAVLNEEKQRIGFFIGTKKWFGIRILGSPSGGTGTFVQGLCMKNEVQVEERIRIYQELVDWCFRNRIASYMQVSDWRLMEVYDDMEARMTWSMPLLNQLGIYYTLRISFFIDTSLSEEELWSNLKYKSCKYPIHKAEKNGLYVRLIENREEIPSFVETLSALIDDVSRRKKVKRHVHHNKKNLMALCNALFPDRILMLQVIGAADDGKQHVMASSIFCIGKYASNYFSGASNEIYMKYCPNEIMVWEAIKILHQRGAGDLILGDVAPYKKKFGSLYGYLPMMVFSKYSFLKNSRVRLKKIYKKFRDTFHK